MPSPLDVPSIVGINDRENSETRVAGDDEPFSALAFKIMADPFVGKLDQSALDRIRAAGEPLTLEELLPPPMPDEDNAAIPLMLAVERLVTPSARDPLLHLLRDPFTVTDDAAAEVEAWIA